MGRMFELAGLSSATRQKEAFLQCHRAGGRWLSALPVLQGDCRPPSSCAERFGRSSGAARFPKRRKILNSSLSVLLPVHNSQATLSNRVQRVLDVLPELTHRFEVVIVDDGSTDATCEVAYELARDFPQVNVFRNAVQQGWAKAVTTPALRAAGDFVMIHCGGTLETDDIVGLWRLRDGIAAAAIAKAKAVQTGKSLRIDGGSIAPAQDKPTSSDLAAGSLGIHARAAVEFVVGAPPSTWAIGANSIGTGRGSITGPAAAFATQAVARGTQHS